MITELKNHSIALHYMSILRDERTDVSDFRKATIILTHTLVLEASRHLELSPENINTPLEKIEGQKIKGKTVLVPILRAGLGMLDAALDILPNAAVAFIGLERDEQTAIAHCYYSKMPNFNDVQRVFLLDPMLATGGSASQSVVKLKESGVENVSMVSIVSAPEGLQHMQESHPDVDIFTASIDRELDINRYILPGLGDFGDRLFGTN